MSLRERIQAAQARDGPHARIERSYRQGFKPAPWWSRDNAATALLYDYGPWLLVFALGMVAYVESGLRLFR
jgi:hypothetical protein